MEKKNESTRRAFLKATTLKAVTLGAGLFVGSGQTTNAQPGGGRSQCKVENNVLRTRFHKKLLEYW